MGTGRDPICSKASGKACLWKRARAHVASRQVWRVNPLSTPIINCSPPVG